MSELNINITTGGVEKDPDGCWLLIRNNRDVVAEIAPSVVMSLAATVAANTDGFTHLFDPIFKACCDVSVENNKKHTAEQLIKDAYSLFLMTPWTDSYRAQLREWRNKARAIVGKDWLG